MVRKSQFVSCAINISVELWREFRACAILQDKKLGDAMAEAIELWMKKYKK